MTTQILNPNEPKRVVITGARGFVGQHLIHELTENWPGVNITGWDLPEVDITKPATYREVLTEVQPDWIVHLAALAVVGDSEKNKDQYFAVNATGTEQLLTAMQAQSPVTRALVVSSAEVYGLTPYAESGEPVGELPLTECRPANPYAASKLAMEQMVVERFADRTIRVRPFPHFGPAQKTGFVTSDFAAQIVKAEHSGDTAPIIKVGNLTSRRDFTDVRDVVRAYRLLMEKSPLGAVFNIGSGHAWSVQEILDRLIALASVPIQVEHDPARLRAVDIPVLVADTRRLREATGWEPTIPLEQSLRDILTWWRSQER